MAAFCEIGVIFIIHFKKIEGDVLHIIGGELNFYLDSLFLERLIMHLRSGAVDDQHVGAVLKHIYISSYV